MPDALRNPRARVMAEPVTIQIDRSCALIRATLAGFWSESDVVAYKSSLAQARSTLASAGTPPSEQRLLVDLTAAAVQSQAVTEQLRGRLLDPGLLDGRIGIVAPSSLGMLQIKRTTQAEDARFFRTESEALAWLLPADAPGGGHRERPRS